MLACSLHTFKTWLFHEGGIFEWCFELNANNILITIQVHNNNAFTMFVIFSMLKLASLFFRIRILKGMSVPNFMAAVRPVVSTSHSEKCQPDGGAREY